MVGKEIFSMMEANKLEGSSNYVLLKVKMKVLLQKEKLWDIICPPTIALASRIMSTSIVTTSQMQNNTIL